MDSLPLNHGYYFVGSPWNILLARIGQLLICGYFCASGLADFMVKLHTMVHLEFGGDEGISIVGFQLARELLQVV